MKKNIGIILSAMLVATTVVGCASKPAPPATTPSTPSVGAPAPEKNLEYPKGDITFLVPSGAGGGNDLTTRALIPEMQRELGVNVVPINKGESKGAIAASEIMTAKPDGQTLYFNSQTLVLMPYGGMPDIKIDEFQPVAQVVSDTGVVYVKADSPYKTIEDFVTSAKTNQAKVAHNGVGAIWHLAALQLSQKAELDFQFVAYTQGGAQMLTALASGEVEMCIVNPAEGKAMVDAGKIRPIAVMSEKRLEIFSDVPTLKESGVDMAFPVWRGVFTKKGTSEEILNELDKVFAKAVESKEFVDYCKAGGLPIEYKDHKTFTEFFNNEVKVYEELMKTAK